MMIINIGFKIIAIIKESFHYCIIGLFMAFSLCSCVTNSKVSNDEQIAEMIDSLNVHRENQNGRAMILILDSLKSFDIKMSDISLYYAVAHAFNGDYDKAIQLLKDSLATSAKPQLFYHELGNIYLGKGDTVQAIIAYKQAIDCNPNYARPYLAMAEVYTKKGDKELAMNNYLAAVTLFETYEAYEDMGIYAAKALKEVDSTNIQMEKFLMYII